MSLKYSVRAVVIFFIMNQTVMAGETSLWKQKDKQAHFAVSAGIAIVTTAYARNKGYNKTEAFLIGFGTSVVIGLAKEVIDGYSKHGNREMDDIKADILGAVSGSLISAQFEWKF